jgi:hypothetical protein
MTEQTNLLSVESLKLKPGFVLANLAGYAEGWMEGREDARRYLQAGKLDLAAMQVRNVTRESMTTMDKTSLRNSLKPEVIEQIQSIESVNTLRDVILLLCEANGVVLK